MDFKVRVKEIRTNLRLTQKEFGELVGKSESTISLYESGNREPSCVKDLIHIADVLGCTLEYLMGRGSNTDKVSIKKEFEIKGVINATIKSYEHNIEESKSLICKEIDNWTEKSQDKIISLVEIITLYKLKIKTLNDIILIP